TAWGKVFDGLTPNVRLEPSAQLRESYITTTIPVGEGIGVKGGLFVSPLGTEIIPIPGTYNDNISRSFLFNLAVPLRHLGTLFSYPVWKKDKDTTIVNATAGIVTGWDDPRDNNTTPSFLGGVAVTPNDTLQFASNIIAGDEPTFVGPGTHPKHNTPRIAWSNVWTIKPIDPLGLSFEYTYGHQSHASIGLGNSDATWQGIAGIASWTWTDRVITAFRAEWFNDRNGARIGGAINGHANVAVGEVTFTGSYKFTKMLMGRAEVRQDFSNQPVFRVGDLTKGNAAFNQTSLALQLLYTY
ncbi:MAG TPA: outer membrane beta-barrel protein, partial [Methylomirabilota bacterium]|nr:outer membrane beta-barrel protein [Methylomirabilota bacterium]